MRKFTFLFFALLTSVFSWQGVAQTSGESCSAPIVINTLPFTDTDNTENYGDNYGPSDMPPLAVGAIGSPSSSYLNGDDVVYAYTPVENKVIDISVTDHGSWAGVFVFTGCQFSSTVGGHTNSSGTLDLEVHGLPVVAGETYYIVISTWATPQSTPYTLEVIDVTPSCMAPTVLTSTDIATTTADIEWTAGNVETAWNISWGELGYTPGDTDELGTDTANATSYQIAGLTSNTQYDVYVQADCGATDGVSDWTGPHSFTTACVAIATMFEDFDSYATGSIVPDCWERMVPATSPGSQSISSTSPASGTRNIYQYTSSTSNPVIVVLPEFDNINTGTHWLRLKARVSSGAPGILSVGYITDASDYDNFTLIQDLSITNTSYTADDAEYTVVVPTSIPTNARIAIKNASDGKSYYWDDVYWEPIPTCLWPTALTAISAFDTIADIEWTAGDTETDWNISWGTPGYTPGDADEIDTASVSNNPEYQITGLTADTHYDVYVQADCGPVDGVSTWAGPLEIFTGYCIPSSTNNADEIRNFTLSNLNNNSAASEGIDGYSDYSNSVAPAELQAGVPYVASLTSGTGSGNHGAAIWIDLNQNGVFEASEMVTFLPSSIGANATVDFPEFTLPNNTSLDTYRLRVQYHYNKSGEDLDPCVTTSNFSETEDYAITVLAPPSCVPPSALTTTGMSATTVDIGWTAGDTETAWNVSWGTPGYTPGDADEIDTASVSNDAEYQITGLTADTHYDVYVQADCGGDESAWVGPLEVFTGYCVPTNTGTYYLSSVSTTGAQVDINHSATSRATDGYADLSQTDIATASAGDVLELTVSANASTHYFFVWIDLDNDMSFDPATETVVDTSGDGYSISFTEQITIPASLPNGDYRVRIGSSWSASSIDPCGPASGEYKDFTLSIVDPPTCPAPTVLLASNFTADSADLSWTAGGTETEWKVLYGEAGFDPLTQGTTLTANNNPETTLSGLDDNTVYEFYVTAICGVGDESLMAGPVSFTTLCNATTIPYVMDFETATVPNLPDCTSRETLAGSDWETVSAPGTSGFTGNALRYKWHTTSGDADSWFYTQGIELEAGVDYELSYKYGNNSTTYTESMSIAYGSSPEASAMTNQLADHPSIQLSTPEDESVIFTVSADGVYYFGFNANSITNQFYLYLDDISIDLAPIACEAVTDIDVTAITQTTATVTWTASATATDGYVVDIYEASTTTAAVFTDTLAAGTTSASITGLSADTTYDVYVTSDCGNGDTDTTAAYEFTTESCDAVTNIDVTAITQTTATVTWTASATASDGYEVNVYEAGTTTLVATETATATETSVDLTGLEAATSYDVVVTSDCGEVTMDSDAFTFTTESCDAVTNIDVTSITETTATVTWTASATASEGYEVNIYETGTTDLVATESATATETSVDLTGLEADTSYDVIVTSDCGEVTMDSDAFTFTTEAIVCDAVTDVEVTDVTAETATVSWTASATAVDGYTVDVYEADANVSNDTPVFTETVTADVTTVEVTGLTHLTEYNVYVTSDCGEGETATSDVITFTTEDIASIGDFDFGSLEVFPNPVSTDLYLSAAKVIEEVQVYNVLGQLVMTQKFNDAEITLDVSNLSTATYLLKVKVDGVVGTVRFVKK